MVVGPCKGTWARFWSKEARQTARRSTHPVVLLAFESGFFTGGAEGVSFSLNFIDEGPSLTKGSLVAPPKAMRRQSMRSRPHRAA